MKYKLRQIKWWFQKRIRGYADCDLWNLDCFLARFLHKIISSYISDPKSGYPTNFEEPEEWDTVLLKIKAGFEAAIDLANEKYIDNYITGYHDEEAHGTDGSTFIIHDMPILDIDGIKKKESELKDIFNIGMDLFKEYFFALWD